ncbi:MAG: hypothetical protein A4E64_00101 [Syntrophorhabdus sp. PtaU1.Bin058]|nr:MAG: hypothetical protein A4E64_00101 [Syntrophorhabdus sp. PtaU1.Bin058]
MITIKKVSGHKTGEHPYSPDTTGTYLVTDNGKEFTIVYRSHSHGSSFALEGEKGSLYTDSETDTVHNQVVKLGGACGLNIDDTLIEGLSPRALQGVIFAEQNRIAEEITLTTEEHE